MLPDSESTKARESRKRARDLLRLGLPVLLLGGLLVAGGWIQARPVWQSRSWPRVEGTLTRFDVGLGTPNRRVSVELMYRPEVAYSYQVRGRSYTGRSLTLTGSGLVGGAELRELQSRYPVGEPVDVFHDPSSPERSALQRGGRYPWYCLPLFLLGALCLLFGAFLVGTATRGE